LVRRHVEWTAVARIECPSHIHVPAHKAPRCTKGVHRRQERRENRPKLPGDGQAGCCRRIDRVLAWLSSVARLFLLGATPSSSRYILPPRAVRHFLEP
jgi:hypothetical protein